MGQQRHTDAGSELVLDDQAYPLLIATWMGPATVELARCYHRWLDRQLIRAQAEGRKIVTLADGSHAGRPGAEVRRAFTEHKIIDGIVVSAVVVIDNPLVRGALTAVGWVIGESFDIVKVARTIGEGIERAAEQLRRHGEQLPPSFVVADYRPPLPASMLTARGA